MWNGNRIRVRVRAQEVRIKVRVKVSLRVKFIFLFCRSIELFPAFYAFHTYILQFCIIPIPVPAEGMKRELHLLRALLICYNTGVMTYCC